MEHQVQHEFFQNHAQSAGTHLAGHSLAGDGPQRFVAKLQPHILKFEQALVLLDDGILRPGEDFDQRKFVQIFQHTDNRQAPNKFRNQAELDQIFRLDFAEQFKVPLARHVVFLLILGAGAEAERLLPHAPANNLFQPHKRSSAYKEDVGGVDRSKFLVRVLASALRRNVGDGSFQNLKQGLLHAFARYIAGNRGIFVLAPDLIDFVDIDDAGLGPAHIAFGSLQKLEDDVL